MTSDDVLGILEAAAANAEAYANEGESQITAAHSLIYPLTPTHGSLGDGAVWGGAEPPDQGGNVSAVSWRPDGKMLAFQPCATFQPAPCAGPSRRPALSGRAT